MSGADRLSSRLLDDTQELGEHLAWSADCRRFRSGSLRYMYMYMYM